MGQTGFSFADVKDKYEWPVTIDIPVGVDGSGKAQFKTKKMIAEFNLLPQDEVNSILANGLNQYLDEEDDEDISLANRVLAGWKNGQVTDEKGEVLEATQENIDTLLNLTFVRNGLLKAYFTSMGGKKAQRKN